MAVASIIALAMLSVVVPTHAATAADSTRCDALPTPSLPEDSLVSELVIGARTSISGQLMAHVLKVITIKQGGYPARIVNIADGFDFGPDMQHGRLHIIPENMMDQNDYLSGQLYTKYVRDASKKIIDVGETGYLSGSGWYVPTYLVSQYTGLQHDWTPLATAQFANAVGYKALAGLSSTDSEYACKTNGLFSNLRVNVTCNRMDATSLVQQIRTKYAARQPFLTYLWTPHFLHAELNLTRVAFPTFQPADYAAAKCDYAATRMVKLGWTGLSTYFPIELIGVFFQLQFSDADMSRLLWQVQQNGVSVAAAACDWMLANAESVRKWSNKLLVSSITPSEGAVDGQMLATLTGFFGPFAPMNFRILIGGLVCTQSKWISPTTATCIVPPGTGQQLHVRVMNGYQQADLENAFTYPPAVLSGIMSLGGKLILSGSEVLLRGEHFVDSPSMQCRFGDVVVNAVYLNFTAITCQSPATVIGSIIVRVSNDGGSRWSTPLGIDLSGVRGYGWKVPTTSIPPWFGVQRMPSEVKVAIITTNPALQRALLAKALELARTAEYNMLPFTTVSALVIDATAFQSAKSMAGLGAAARAIRAAIQDQRRQVSLVIIDATLPNTGYLMEEVEQVTPKVPMITQGPSPWTPDDYSDPELHSWALSSVESMESQAVQFSSIVVGLVTTAVTSGLLSRINPVVIVVVNPDDEFSAECLSVLEGAASSKFDIVQVAATTSDAAALSRSLAAAASTVKSRMFVMLVEPSRVRTVFMAASLAQLTTAMHSWSGIGPEFRRQALTWAPSAVVMFPELHPLSASMNITYLSSYMTGKMAVPQSTLDVLGSMFDGTFAALWAIDRQLGMLGIPDASALAMNSTALLAWLRTKPPLPVSGFGGWTPQSNFPSKTWYNVDNIVQGTATDIGSVSLADSRYSVTLSSKVDVGQGGSLAKREIAIVLVERQGVTTFQHLVLQISADTLKQRYPHLGNTTIQWWVVPYYVDNNYAGVVTAIQNIRSKIPVFAVLVQLTSGQLVNFLNFSPTMKLPVVALTSTADILSNQTRFPWLVRVVPPDSMQATALLELARRMQWTRIIVVYNPLDTYSNGIQTKLTSLASTFSVKIAANLAYPGGTLKVVPTVVTDLQRVRKLGYKVVFLVGDWSVACGPLIAATQTAGLNDLVFIGDDALTGASTCTTSNSTWLGNKMIKTAPARGLLVELSEFMTMYRAYLKSGSLTPLRFESEAFKNNTILRRKTAQPNWATSAVDVQGLCGVDGAGVVLKALDDMIAAGDNPTDGLQAMKYVRAVQLTSSHGLALRSFEFDRTTNDPITGNFWYQSGTTIVGNYTKVDTLELVGCPPGQYRQPQLTCGACPRDTYKSWFGNDGACTSCPIFGDTTMTTNGTKGATSVSACLCPIGWVRVRKTGVVQPTCVPCPVGATCNRVGMSPSDIFSQPGYWRSGLDSLTFEACLADDACPGTCSEGRWGVLCQNCAPGYKRDTATAPCEQCPEPGVVYFTALLGIIGSSILIAFLIAQQTQKGGSSTIVLRRVVSIKSLLSFWQFSCILGHFSAPWGDNLRDMFRSQSRASASILSMFAWECYDFSIENRTYVRFLICTVLTLLVVFVLFVVECVSRIPRIRLWERFQHFLDVIIAGQILGLYLLYPPVLLLIFQMLDCHTMENGVRVLRIDTSILCDSDSYASYHGWALACVGMIGFGVPILFHMLLRSNRDNLVLRLGRRNVVGKINVGHLQDMRMLLQEAMAMPTPAPHRKAAAARKPAREHKAAFEGDRVAEHYGSFDSSEEHIRDAEETEPPKPVVAHDGMLSSLPIKRMRLWFDAVSTALNLPKHSLANRVAEVDAAHDPHKSDLLGRSELLEATFERCVAFITKHPSYTAKEVVATVLDEVELVLRTQRRYGFLYMSYRPRMYYWETVTLLRKSLLALCAVLLSQWMHYFPQLVFALVLSLASLVITVLYRPFQGFALLERHGVGYLRVQERRIMRVIAFASLHFDLMDPAGQLFEHQKAKYSHLPWYMRVPEFLSAGTLESTTLTVCSFTIVAALLMNDVKTGIDEFARVFCLLVQSGVFALLLLIAACDFLGDVLHIVIPRVLAFVHEHAHHCPCSRGVASSRTIRVHPIESPSKRTRDFS